MKYTIFVVLVFLVSACAPSANVAPTSVPDTATPMPLPTETATTVPTDTATPTPTETFTPTIEPSSTPTDTPEPTSTPIYQNLQFEEDFETDKMGWKNASHVTAYGDGKISFDFPKETDDKKKYYGSWTLPRKPLSIKGNAMVEVTFDRPVWFSGVFFQKSSKTRYALIAGCGDDIANWKSNNCTLGFLNPSDKNPWENINDNITDSIRENDGQIKFSVEFLDDQMKVYINDVLAATKTDEMFRGTKTMGINNSNGDTFDVTEIKVLIP